VSKEKRRPDQEGWFEPAFDGRPLLAALATVVIAIVVLIAGLWFCFFSFCALAPTGGPGPGLDWNDREQFGLAALVCLGISIGGILLIIKINRKK
jgi:hypothetical protein